VARRRVDDSGESRRAACATACFGWRLRLAVTPEKAVVSLLIERLESDVAMSKLLPYIGSIVDDITLIRSMLTFNSSHGPAIATINTDRPFLRGRSSLGSWVTCRLGTARKDLPTFVGLTDEAGLPLYRDANWSNGFIPSIYQGTMVSPHPAFSNSMLPNIYAVRPNGNGSRSCTSSIAST